MKVKANLKADTTRLESDMFKYLESSGANFVKAITEFGADSARNNLQNIDTGETLASIEEKTEGNKGAISAGGAAVWLEFGTGVAKNGGSYPLPLPSGIVPVGTYGKGNGANPNGWYYFDERQQHYVKTKGIKANLFMYKAAKDMEENADEIARGVFGK